METTATLRSLRIAPRKVRVVVDTIRGHKADKALAILTFTHKAAALPVAKLVRSALANAEKAGRNIDNLWIRSITVDQGQTQRRFMPRAMGRAFRINKKTSHIVVVLDEKA